MHYKERVPKRNIDPKEIEEYMKKQKEKKEEKLSTNTLEKPKIVELKEDPKSQVTVNSSKENLENKEHSSSVSNKVEEVKTIESSKQTTLIESKIDPKYSAISTYNGDSCDQYNWSQGTNDVSIQIYLLENTAANKVIFH